MYTMLCWEKEAIEKEEQEMEEARLKAEGKNNGSGKRFNNVKDDPQSINLINKMIAQD